MTISNTSRGLRPGVCLSTNRPANPFDGQVIYETDTDLVKAFNGTAFVTVGPGGLELISTTTIGTTVASVTVTGAFSATFDNYVVNISGGVGNTDNMRMDLQLGSITTGYYQKEIFGTYSNNTVSGAGTSNAANFTGAVRATTDSLVGTFTLFAPNLTKKTAIVKQEVGTRTAGSYAVSGGFLDNTTAISAFTLICSDANTVTGGTIRVYGYRN